MLITKEFGAELEKMGYAFFTGVPCSFLKDLINYAINDCEYIAAVNEGDAVAMAAGAYIGGKKAVVLMQNSGLTNAISPLTSLNHPFKIPVLGFVSLRGEVGIADEPQHGLMGSITLSLLEQMEINHAFLSPSFAEAKSQLLVAQQHLNQNRPYFFVVRKGTFSPEPLRKQLAAKDRSILPTRYQVLQTINRYRDNNTVLLATTGKTGRELYTLEDAKNNLYMVGSMGCISSFGMGMALSKPNKEVVVIDGDGSLLMRLGNLTNIGHYSPANLMHILLDNNSYDSTGGQRTVSAKVDFAGIARACGYTKAIEVSGLQELTKQLDSWKKDKKLTFLYLKIAPGSQKNLGRPKVKPDEVAERLKEFLDD